MFALSSLVISAAIYPVELQRLADTYDFLNMTDGMLVVVQEVNLTSNVSGPLYTGYNVESDVCVVYYNTSAKGKESLRDMLKEATTPELRKAWLYTVMAHEVGHCMHDHFSLIDKESLGAKYSESVRRIEAEADVFGLYQAKQVFSAPVYEVVYKQFMAMRAAETEHAHSTHSFLRLVSRIRPESGVD